MVKRLNKIRPFVANTRPLDTTSYKLKRSMQRTNEQQNARLKHQSNPTLTQTTSTSSRTTRRTPKTATSTSSRSPCTSSTNAYPRTTPPSSP